MTYVSNGIAVLGFVFLIGSPAFAQPPAPGGPPPPPMTNLQVWPKDTPRAQVIQTMRAFNESLGVGCTYCHVEGPGGRNDFASDEKRTKRVARQMILFRDAINVMLPSVVAKPAGAGPTAGAGNPGAPMRVLCSTCHRGLPIPKQLYEIVAETAAAGGGAAAGLAKIKELRAQYFGGGAGYNFSENGLVIVADRSAKTPDEAIMYLQANLEYYPKSAMTYVALAQARNTKGDKAGAIKDLEKALEFDPNNAQAKTQLQQLKGQ